MSTQPTLFMRATTTDHSGRIAQWSIYAEPQGIRFSWQILTNGGSVFGSARAWQQARNRIDAYLAGVA